MIGGGSNLLVADGPFNGVVVRDARRQITVPDEAAPVENGERIVHVNAEAGCNWDDFVAFTVELGLEGVEGLVRHPRHSRRLGGAEHRRVRTGSRRRGRIRGGVGPSGQADAGHRGCRHGIRIPYERSQDEHVSGSGGAGRPVLPTPRYVVLSVTFALRHSTTGTVGYGQLAKALGVEVGDRMETAAIRNAVLKVRAAKGMLEDAARYLQPAMAGTKRDVNVRIALEAQRRQLAAGADTPVVRDPDRHSCGSFFMNPVLPADAADRLPQDAPRFPRRCRMAWRA